MKINTNCSFEALCGLVSRANTDERLRIADEWLRANEKISIQEYQYLRAKWHKQIKLFGTHKVIIECGSVKYEIAHGLTGKQAYLMCKHANWKWNHNNGCMWDMSYDWEG